MASEMAVEQPLFAVKTARNVRIAMPDGVALAADLYLPDVAEAGGPRFPAVIEYTPYHKNNNAAYGPRATRYPYFASHGYVFVNVDIRGTGDSGGCSTSPSSPEEARDGVDVIRWCARQPWCDGNVGMIGISYTAGVCYDAARQAPPELKAVILCQMMSDWYDGMACPGGSPRPFAWENYAPLMAAYNFAPPHPELVGAEWSALWQQRLERSVPWSIEYLEHLVDGPFWERMLLRGREEDLRAATFLIGGWCDWYPDDFLRVFSRLQCPKRALIGPWTHNYPENAWPLPRINDRYECRRWFDRYLKGIDTDLRRPLEQEPPIALFVREFTPPAALRREDAGRFQHETEWPPAHLQPQTLLLTTDGRCTQGAALGTLGAQATRGETHSQRGAADRSSSQGAPSRTLAATGGWGRSEAEPPARRAGGSQSLDPSHPPSEGGTTNIATRSLTYRPDVGIAAGRYVIGQMLPGWGMPDDQRLDEGLSLLYTGEPFDDDGPRELVGVPRARLWLSSTAEVAFLSVKLCDAAPDGTSVLISKGVLNLTHRRSHTNPEPLVPGEVYEIDLPLLALAYRFQPGHRLRVMIAAADFQNAWPTPLPHTLTIHHGPQHPSCIMLPFCGPRPTPLPAAEFLPSDFPPLPPEQIPTPQYGVTRDLIRNALTVDIRTQSGVGVNTSRYTVHVDRPADAAVHSEYEYPLHRPGMAIVVRASCVTRSDAQAFHHVTDVDITVNGAPHFRKSWTTSVPRPWC